MAVPLLEVKGVCFEAGGKKILENVSISVNKGEVHSVMGVNGTGKTTLAAIVMGLDGYKPCAGRVFFKGEDITKLNVTERSRRGITLAWQNPAFFEGVTVRDYLSVNKESNPEELLAQVGLNPKQYLGRAVDESLSGGERKRIELASVLSVKPELVILDEPDSGIDLASIDVLLSVLKKMKKEGAGVLLITHNEKMAGFGDVVSLMCNGVVVKQGKPGDVAGFFKENCSECEHVGVIKEEKLNERGL